MLMWGQLSLPTSPVSQIFPTPQHPHPRRQRGPVPRRAPADWGPRRPGGAPPLPQIHRHPAVHCGPQLQTDEPPLHPRGHKVGPRCWQAHQQGHPGGGRHLRLHRSLSQHLLGQITSVHVVFFFCFVLFSSVTQIIFGIILFIPTVPMVFERYTNNPATATTPIRSSLAALYTTFTSQYAALTANEPSPVSHDCSPERLHRH